MEREDSLEDSVARLLATSHAEELTTADICEALGERGNKSEVNRILYKRLYAKKLCDVCRETRRPTFKATEALLQRYQTREPGEEGTDDGHAKGVVAAIEGEGSANVRYEAPQTEERGVPSPRDHQTMPNVVNGSPSVHTRQRSNVVSTMPVQMGAGHQPSAMPQPCYFTGQIFSHTGQPAAQMYGHVGEQLHPPQMVIPNGTIETPGWYPQTVVVQGPPGLVQSQIQPQMQQQPQRQPQRIQRRDQPSILRLKRVPRSEAVKERVPRSTTPVKQRNPKEGRGQVDASIFPEGLWNHVLYETRETRSQTEAVEKLMSQKLKPVLGTKEPLSGISKHANMTPEGRGTTVLSMDAVKSLNAMGPPPPGFSLAPCDRALTEASASSPPSRPVSQFTQESSERGTDENERDLSPEVIS